MSTCVVPGLLYKYAHDTQTFILEWAEELDMNISVGVSASDKIDASSWAIDSASPASSVTITDQGFDDTRKLTWLAISGGVDGDQIYINNTITTEGVQIGTGKTPVQTLVRQIRVRIREC